MFVVIFQATLANPDADYLTTANRLREKAFQEYGCTRFVSCCENGREITLSYWPSRQHIAAWAADPDHQTAQQRGRQDWYLDYQVEVAEIQERPGT